MLNLVCLFLKHIFEWQRFFVKLAIFTYLLSDPMHPFPGDNVFYKVESTLPEVSYFRFKSEAFALFASIVLQPWMNVSIPIMFDTVLFRVRFVFIFKSYAFICERFAFYCKSYKALLPKLFFLATKMIIMGLCRKLML